MRDAAQAHFGGTCECLILRHGEIERLTKKLADDEAGALDGDADDGNIEHAVLKLFEQLIGCGFAEVEIDTRVAIDKAAEGRSEEVRQGGGDGSDAEQAVDTFTGGFQMAGESGGVFENGAGFGKERFAKRREFDTAVEAFEEGTVEGLFQFRDLFRQRRLSESEFGGGFGETAGAGDGAEAFHLGEDRTHGNAA